MCRAVRLHSAKESGFTVLEVILAIFIFGCITSALFNLIGQTDRLYGRSIYVSKVTSLALAEAERLRSSAVSKTVVEDSTYTETVSGRTFRIERDVVEQDETSLLPKDREPLCIMLRISEEGGLSREPIHFRLLLGEDNP